MRKVSLIIPVYNTDNYLVQCLQSAVDQTYPNIEIICVDDGSTDGSEKIVDDFAKKYGNVVVVHQKNGGESAARNTGLRIASGDYIGFMDCDDWIESNMYESLVSVMEQEQVDLVAASWFVETGRESIPVQNNKKVVNGVFGQKQLLRYIYERDAYRGFAYMWDKLYKRELFCDESGKLLLFDESLKLGGDVLFLAQLALNAQKAIYLDIPFYHYRQREGSGCHTSNLERMRDWIRAYELILQKFYEKYIPEDIISYVKRFMAYHSSNAMEMAINQQDEEWIKYFQDKMLKYEKEYIELNKEYIERIERYQKLKKEAMVFKT